MGLFEDITGLTTNKSKKTNKNVLDFKAASNNYLLESDRAKARIDKLNQLNDREARDLSIALQEKERARDEYLKNNKNKSIQSVNANFERSYDNTAINESQRRYNETHKGLDMFSVLGQSGLELLDFGKRTAATGLDLGLDVLQGGLNQLEGGVDWATYRLADVADFFGGKSLAEDLKRNADFSSTNALFGTSQNEQDNLFGNWQKGIEETSYSPDILDNIGQSVGQVLMMGGTSLLTGGSALGTAGVVYASAYGNARSEAKRNGASDEEANKVGIINGVAETISEQFFSGIPGMKVEGWGDKRIGKLTDKVTKYFGTNTGKVALKVFDSLGEGTEEIISNILTAAGNDIVHYFDKDFSYGMENQSGNILEDMLDQVFNSDTWTQFFSAAITSALVNGGKAFIDTKTKNKIINAYAKDNNMSFKDANYILTGQLENAKQEIKRDEIEYNSQVELQQLAEQRVLNFMKSYTGENIESTIKDELKKEQKKLGIKLNVEEQEKLEKDIRAKYEDSINSRERYTQFTQETDNEKDSALVKSMQEAKMNNTKQAHEVYDFVKSLTDKNPNAKIEFTNNELLEKQGAKITDENGNKATINGYYKDGVIHINMNTKNPYRQVVYHEIGHAIKETDEQLYNEMKNLIFELKGKERLSNYKDLYQVKDGEIISDLTDNVEDEYVNDMLGEILESDRFINTFRDNRTLLQKILDKLKEIISSITSTQEQKHFRQIEKRLQELYKQGYEQAEFTGNEKTDYSLLDIFKKKSDRERSYDISDEFKQEIEQRTRNNLANNDKVQFINIDDIKRNGETGGYRTIDETDSLINNIMAEGMKAPIRVYRNSNGDTLIYDGNHRYEIAKRLGLKEIPVVYETHSDTQYSLSQDNQGRELSKQQQEFFKDSKVRDEQGRLLEVYHGTPNTSNFTVFDTNKSGFNTMNGEYGIYFTDSKKFADDFSYERIETDSMFFDKKGEKGKVYTNYLNITNPLDFSQLTEDDINNLYKYASEIGKIDGKEQFIENMLNWQQIGNHQLMKGNLNLKEIAENSSYDGVKAKLDVKGNENEYIVFNSNQIKNVDNTNPTTNEDIRYQLGTQENLPTGLENTKLIETTEDYLNTLPRTNLPINTQEEDNELPFYVGDEIETIDERMQDRRRKYADERFKKIMEKQTYKSIDSAAKMAKNYLGFNQQETKDFKSKIEKLSQLSKDKLIKAKNYNQLKDIIKQYATKDQTFINQELRDAQREIRNTELIVSNDLKAQITDWSDFKKYSGLKIRAGIRSNVDSVYQELLESYTGMLDNTITNYADQLQELSEFVKRDNKYIEHFELTEDTINQITNKVWDKLSQNALTEQEINDLQQEITEKAERRTREVVRNDLLEQMGITEQDLQVGKDISSIGYQRTDPRRLNEKVFGYEVGNKINQATNGFVQHQEANKIRWLNKERNEISDLGIKPKSKMSAAIQKYGEKQYVNEKGEVVEYNDQTLMSEFPNIADQEKIKNAVEVLRQKYDEYIDKMNESLMEMGYDPVPKRKDYFRHFIELEDKLSQFGFTFSKENIMKEELPTDINGLTDGFKPGKNFFASAMARKGLKTTYDAITGIDQYLSGVSDVIYHTESIQRYRALSKFIRDTYGQTHGTENIDMMTPEEAEQRIQDVYDNKLSRYAAWLDEQANALANKKAAIDRSVERIVGRKGYTLLNGLKKQVGSNMTGFNVRSAMTNFASAIQGASKTEKLSALQGFAFALKNYRNIDALVEKSDMLATRFGTDLLSKKTWQKMSEAGQVFMNATDRFTTLQIWGGKYYEGLHHGLSEQEAIKQADDFTSRIMGDRSKGQTAEIFNSKTLGLFTQFQLEVNNQWSSMIHDNKMAMKQNPGLRTGLHIANQLGQLYAATWFFNNFMKAVTGSEVIFDPIDILMGIFSPDDDKSIEEKTTEALGKIINELPMASVFTGGRIPLSEAFTGIDTGFKYITGQKDKYGNNYTPEDVKNDFLGSIAYYLLPTGYGQLKKTTQGLSMYNNELPGSYTDSGKLRFEADTSPLGMLQSAVFGQYASGNAREYFDNGYSPLTEKQVNEAMDANLPIAEYREIDKGIKEAKKEAKESGKSQSEAQYNYIYNLPISMEQKNTLINSRLGTSDNVTDDNGYVKYTDGNKTYWYDESNDTVYNSKYREMDNIDIKDLTKYSNKKDLTDYGKYGSLDEFNFATNNPTKYSTIQQITSYDNYVKYKDDISAIKDNYNDNTKQGQKKAQQKVFNYINSLPLNKYQKIMLQKIGAGYSIKNYEKQVFNYINGLKLSKAEKQKIHKELFE